MAKMKMVIFKIGGEYKCTTFDNYFGMIRNARLVQDCSAFQNPAEIIAYYAKYFGSKEDDFVVYD